MCSAGGHQADQLAEAAEEGADHQRDPGHEGAEEPQHRQLRRQVALNAPQAVEYWGLIFSIFLCGHK